MNGQFELGVISPRRYFFGLAVVLGLVFALVGGGDDEAGFFARLFLWQFQTVTPMALLVGSHMLLLRWRWFEAQSRWVQLVISGVAGVLLFSPLNLGLDLWLEVELTAADSVVSLWLEELGYMAPPVIVCWLALNAPWVMGFRLQRQQPAAAAVATAPIAGTTTENPATDPVPPFMTLLPEALQGELIYMKAELHYLLVVTCKGKHLLLYNLRDAVAELPAGLGLLCHRSWWVHRGQVRRLHKQGRQGELELLDGTCIPVSRNSMTTATELFSKSPTN